MLFHQRIEEEAEIMYFMIGEEFKLNTDLQNLEKTS